MRTRKIFSTALMALMALMLLVAPLGLLAQTRTPTVDVRKALAAVSRTTTGTYWTTGQDSLNFHTVMLRVVTTGTPTTCKLAVFTGPTAALATVLADDPKSIIDCTAAGGVNHVVRALDSYFNVKLETLSGGSTPAVQVYATLTNGYTEGEFLRVPLSAVTAAVASATLTEVAPVPATGSIVVNGVLVEKSAGAAGTYTIRYGTGTNCGSGTTTILGPVTNPPVGFQPASFRVPAANALCLATDGATTGVRLLINAQNK